MNDIAIWLGAGFIGGIAGSLFEWRRNRSEIKQAWDTADEQRKRAWAARDKLRALSQIVRRSLACGQMEKLDDAKPYLDEER